MRHVMVPALWLWIVSTAPVYSEQSRQVYEVRARASDSLFFKDGHVARNAPGDEAIYVVDLPRRKVVRTAFYNRSLDPSLGGGIQTDQTVYTIVHDGVDPVSGQHVIKAFGRTARADGYELLVIGDEFVESSRSTADYFVLHHYDRLDALSAVE